MTNAFQMTIGGDGGEIARVNAAFATFAAAHSLAAPARRSVQVALDELLTNAFAHGAAGQAEVAIDLQRDRLRVTLTDDGRPFDPFGRPVPDTALPLEERDIGGLGVHLVRGLMDEVSYQRRGDRNVVVLTKFLSGG